MALRPMLGDIELQQVQRIDSDQDQLLVRHAVPALEGDFLQGLGRRATVFVLDGVLTGPEVADGITSLREKFHAAEPVSFAADIATATRIDQVLIEAMDVREIAGHALRFEYSFLLREFIPPPTPRRETPPPPPPPQELENGILEVEVIVEGHPEFDHSATVVTVEGTQDDGSQLSRTLSTRANNLWTETEFPPGSYTCRARVEQPQVMTGSAQATVRPGQTIRAIIRLRPGARIAKAFVVHFWFDKAFIEPCLRAVLRQIAAYASAHPDEKLVIVGHTDLVGGEGYNQSLSERRSRSVFAWLTAGRDAAASRAEWEDLRRTRPAGEEPSLKDSWATREYQFMLNDLGFYLASIDEDHGPLTTAAVRAFQLDQGLPQTGSVDDATWSALIAAYLAQDNLAVAESQFLPNAKDGCSNGVVKWLGCGEKDPVRNTQDAWRPNRRTELLFVRASEFPCEIPKPVTFDLPAPGGNWCLGPGDPNQRCCFLARGSEQPDKWLVVPAESGQLAVGGTVTRPDGTPVANAAYALMDPTGEYLHANAAGQADLGERPSGPQRGRPIANRTAADGSFIYPDLRPVGTYILHLLELQPPAVARWADEPPQAARGNFICRRLEAATTGSLPAVIEPGPTPAVTVTPTITLAAAVVVVRKVHTNPARVQVTLGVSSVFTGNGTLTRTGNFIDLFPAAAGGAALTYNGIDNLFTGAQLGAGVTLFAEGTTVSAAMDDVQLTLTLSGGASPIGPPAIVTMTALELTLDVALSRTAAGVDPPLLSAVQKINPGRFVQVRDPGLSHERAMLIVQPPRPAGFTGTLVLTTIDTPNPLVRLFTTETPAAADVVTATPHPIPAGPIPATGARFFIEARTFSPAVRNTGFRLGVQGGEADGDRVNMTAVQVEMVATPTAAAAAATFVRMGLWDNAFNAAGVLFNQLAEANNFAGADSRKVHIRVRDAAARTTGSVQADWRTQNQANNNLDAPANPDITLVEVAATQGTFISRGLLLVSDNQDRDQTTHSGLAAPLPDAGLLRARGQRNHRTRRGTLFGSSLVEYRPAPGIVLPLRLPVFRRNPEERRRMPLQIFVLRVAAGGAGVIPTAAGSNLWDRDLRIIRESYERIGITVSTFVAPGTAPANIVTVGGDSVVLINPPAGVNPLNVAFAPVNDESTIGAAFPAAANTLRIFYTGGLASGNRGESWPDANFAATPQVGASFINGATYGPYTVAHEIGHVLTNKNATVNTGHYRQPAAPAGNRLQNNQNLMRNGTSAAEGVNQSKRLWDNNDGDGVNQYTSVRGSRYTRNF